MDALLAAALRAAPAGEPPRIVMVPTAAARHRPDLAAANGERAFLAAAARARIAIEIAVAGILERGDAFDPRVLEPLETAHLVHFPGGDPDLIPEVFRATPAWGAILRALAGGACVAGASAGAMAFAERCWTPTGEIDGLGLVPGFAVLPHDSPGRSAARDQGSGGRRVSWLGIEEQTLVIGRIGGAWRVAGRGRARVIPADGSPTRRAAAGELLELI